MYFPLVLVEVRPAISTDVYIDIIIIIQIGKSPLSVAAQGGKTKMVTELLRLGANPNYFTVRTRIYRSVSKTVCAVVV